MQNVRIDREKYIGGSDIPCIMGLTNYMAVYDGVAKPKTRFELLLEKAGRQVSEFTGNEFTEYGNVMEGKIRDHLNKRKKKKFVEDKVIDGDRRYHSDGFDGTTVLEVKTTSQIYEDVNEYKKYLVQLLDGMMLHNVKKGLLAVYYRDPEFNEEFDPGKLHTFDIKIGDYKELCAKILEEVERFRFDLAKVKEDPFITEEDLQPKEVIELANKATVFEVKLAEYNKIKEEYDALKANLYKAMEQYSIKTWEMNNGTKVTRVLPVLPSTTSVEVFDVDTFKAENADLYQKYMHTEDKTSNGRSGYVKITLPKGTK